MKNRLFFLGILLLFRFVLGYSQTAKYQSNREITVTGNIDRIYQSDNKCITYIGRFILQTESFCAVFRNENIRATGTVSDGVITRFLGKISLVDGKIYRLDKFGNYSKVCGRLCAVTNIFREYLLNIFRRNVPEPEAGLVAGIVLGYKNDIGQDFNQKLINSGTIHIAVASGYNIMLVGGIVLSFCFWFLKRKRATGVAIFIMIIYAVLAGGEPPIVRAIWMAGLIYISQAIGRAGDSMWVLSLAVWAMLIWDPSLVGDVSFQLSVAASIGMIGVEPWLSGKVESILGEKVNSFFSGLGLTTSLATMSLTAPIIWWHFGRMSWIGVVSNTLILPMIPILMSLSGMMLIFGKLMSIPVYAVAHFMVVVIGFLGS